ncbi:MAG: PPOX class F420-dependent oxidoreductase [Candidatus Dormiibacterota bacterium]
MPAFTSAEIAYLRSQRLCRLATATPDGHPHVVPVTFVYNEAADTIDIGGHDFATRKKWRDVGRNPEVALVVDDIPSFDPWQVRMLEVRGNAERLGAGGKEAIGGHVDPEMFRIHPRFIQSIGINGENQGIASRRV